jgi:two-component system nitrogen regulation response regulator GlnG/two-component system response regulator HydG
VNCARTDRALLRDGDVVEIRGHYVFLFTQRLLEMPGDRVDPARAHSFGEPDAHGIVGESPAAWALRAQLRKAARKPGNVLLVGESGAGKELAANAIHAQSSRASGPLTKFNGAMFTAGLMVSELCGNLRNYPNHGQEARDGLIGGVEGGTFMLDEIGEIPRELQSALLRLLESGEYVRLGEKKPRIANVRFVGATNRDPAEALRSDIAARFKVKIHLPSLAMRREDIPLLVRQLLLKLVDECRDEEDDVARLFVRKGVRGRREVAMEGAFVAALMQRAYPTNVRELEEVLWAAIDAMEIAEGAEEATLVLTPAVERVLTGRKPSPIARTPVSERAPKSMRGRNGAPRTSDKKANGTRALTADLITAALHKNRWSMERTAAALGVSRFALGRRMSRLGIAER